MDNTSLRQILVEYDAKRRNAILLSEKHKEHLLNTIPEYASIEKELAKISIDASKAILISDSEEKKGILDKLKNEIQILTRKKHEILKNISLEPKFECNKCKDTGYILENNLMVMCSCLKQKLFDNEFNKCNIGNFSKDNFANFSFEKYSDEVNKEKYKSNISPRENIKIIKEICEKFINNFDNPNELNLLFTGNTGLGKTFLSNCIAYELIKKGKTVLYQTSPFMLDTIINYKFGKIKDSYIVDNLYTVDLLIIDDLGTENMNNIKFTELFNIINTRLLNQNNKITKTIISTNLSLKNIFSTYEERLGSRFVGNYNICRFFGDDIRFMK